MNIKYAFFFCLVFAIRFCQAQSTISVGPDLGLAAHKSNASVGIGASLEYSAAISHGLGFRAFGGYSHFNAKSGNTQFSMVPVRAGLQAGLGETFLLYGEAGISAVHTSAALDNSGFTYAFGGGYRVPFTNDKKFLQVSAFYSAVRFDRSYYFHWVDIRVAYGLKMGKNRSRQ
jgi:opacity protein-like surface antigen